MKSASLIVIGLLASVLLSAQPNLKAATETGTKFDGSWAVTLDAKAYKNPNGSTAQPYVWRFSATVKNGVFHGERGMRKAHADQFNIISRLERAGKFERQAAVFVLTRGGLFKMR
jgi:hypothetical protein